MRFYGHSYQDTMTMPLKAFWALSSTMMRVIADEDIRQLALHVRAAQGSIKSIEEYRTALEKEVGSMIKEEEVLDMDGWNQLKMMAQSP